MTSLRLCLFRNRSFRLYPGRSFGTYVRLVGITNTDLDYRATFWMIAILQPIIIRRDHYCARKLCDIASEHARLPITPVCAWLAQPSWICGCAGAYPRSKRCGGGKISARAYGARNILPILLVLKTMVLKHPQNDSCAKNKFSGKVKKIHVPMENQLEGNIECMLRAP